MLFAQFILISLDLYVSHNFAIRRGVKQGCPLSPGLFNAILQFVMQKLQDQIRQLGIGLNIHDQHLSNLRFADDILLLATSQDDAICMLEILVLELEEIGLILNPNKTKMLTTELHDHDFVFLQNGSKIDVIRDHASHKWLGKAICFTKGSLHCHAIDSRIAAATRAFYAKKHILCAKHIPIGARLRYFNSTISQIACFARSSTTLTRQDSHKLDVAFRSLARKVVGHPSSWDYTRPYHELLHATHERLTHFCKQSNISSWSVIARTRQWQFIGNVMRGDSRKWCFQLFRWIPLGERARGRPRMRFQDQFDLYWDHMKAVARSANLRARDHWIDAIDDHKRWAKQLPSFIEYHAL